MNIVVTGGSRGIGAAIVQAAVAEGHDVAFTYRANYDAANRVRQAAEKARPGARCESYQLDVRDAAQVDQVADQIIGDFEQLHAVVLNAGINRNGLAVSMSNQDWADVLDTNLSGAFYVARSFLSHFLPNRHGRLVFISSIGARGVSGQVSYCASKAGLLGLSKALAKEYGGRGITSNCIIAGFFDTDMTRDGMSESNEKFWLKYCPAKRMGGLEELAAAVSFLVSDAASFVNGQELPVTGGLDWAP